MPWITCSIYQYSGNKMWGARQSTGEHMAQGNTWQAMCSQQTGL